MRTRLAMRIFFSDVRKYGLLVAWWNFRFNLGYRIGGFTSAKR
jgi:hypothetical protein